MKLHNPHADVMVPDEMELGAALARTTHLGVGAHQDDLEIMALHGILECYGRSDRWFTGVTCTNGSGSSRTGLYAQYTDEDMMGVRRQEQRNAARLGQYAAVLQLGYASKEVKDTSDPRLQEDLAAVLRAALPKVVYTHNPADKHATHVAVMTATLRAIRSLPADRRPEKLYACEVWRDLDWVPDKLKTVLDVGGRESLAAALVGVYDSQIAGGKRYDLATLGRRRANATYFESHGTDAFEALTFALDLTPLVRDEGQDLVAHVRVLMDAFRQEVEQQLAPVAR